MKNPPLGWVKHGRVPRGDLHPIRGWRGLEIRDDLAALGCLPTPDDVLWEPDGTVHVAALPSIRFSGSDYGQIPPPLPMPSRPQWLLDRFRAFGILREGDR